MDDKVDDVDDYDDIDVDRYVLKILQWWYATWLNLY